MTIQPNERPRREQPNKHWRKRSGLGLWKGAIDGFNINAIKADYLTGDFTIQQLMEKYDVRERSLLWYVRLEWKKILIASGKTPPVEPKLSFKYKPPAFWKDLEIEWRHGATIKELATKHDIHPNTIAKKMSKEGWVLDKKSLPGWGTRSSVTPSDMGIRMENLTATVRNHVERVLEVLENYSKTRKHQHDDRINVEELDRISAAMNSISQSFASIVETGLKLYKFTVMSQEAEEQACTDNRQASSKKAMEAGMRPSPIKPNKMAVPIRIERPGNNAFTPRPA